MKVLIIDNNIDPPYGCEEIRNLIAKNAPDQVQVESFRAPDSKFPNTLKGFDAAVLSGSKTRIFENAPWIDKEMDLLRGLHREKIPTLGICYGEQLMARVFAGEKTTGAANVPEFGWTEIELLSTAKKSKIFNALPEKFHSYSFHSDEVYEKLPNNFLVTAKSKDCAVQAFDMTDAPMWGVQFHPERGLEEGNRSKKVDQKNKDLGKRVYDEKIANGIFSSFMKVVFKESA